MGKATAIAWTDHTFNPWTPTAGGRLLDGVEYSEFPA